MADLDEWTTRAQQQRHHSVVLAVPASSHPWSESMTGELGAEFAFGASVPGAVFGAAIVGLGVAWNEVRRFRNRKNPIGEREANERVTLLFYEDRVDVHGRRVFSKRIGDLKDSYPLTEFAMGEDPMKLYFDDVVWITSASHGRETREAFFRAGIAARDVGEDHE